MTPEGLYSDIILGLEAMHFTTKAIKKPKGTRKAVEVYEDQGPLGRVYLRSKSVHVRARGAPRSTSVTSKDEALERLTGEVTPAPSVASVALSDALAAFRKGDFEQARDEARAVLEANPRNEAAGKLLEKCERMLSGEAEAAAPPAEQVALPEVAETVPVEPGPEIPAPPEEPHPVVAHGVEPRVPRAEIEEVVAAPVVEEPAEEHGIELAEPVVTEAPVVPPPPVPPPTVAVPKAPPSPPRPPRRRIARWPLALLGLAIIVVVVVLVSVSRRKGERESAPTPAEPVENAEAQRRARAQELAERAERMERMGRLWGDEQSAGALYAALLAEEPLSPSARVGALRVADSLRSLADSAFAGGEFAAAGRQYQAVVALVERCLNALPADTAFQRRLNDAGGLVETAELRTRLFSDMAFVPGGAFSRGDNEGPLDSRPRRRHVLRRFWIDRHEVTNSEYRLFIDATGRQPPPHWPGGNVPAGDENKPVVNVTWNDAVAFAEWAGKRLPTEAEWEKAARGADGSRYPWGSRFSSESCNTRERGLGRVAAAGSYPQGASPYGVTEMAGNAREWTRDLYDGRYYITAPQTDPRGPRSGTSRVVRGGSYRLSREWALAFARGRLRPDEREPDLGFRCASDVGPSPLGDPATTPPAE